MHQYLVRQGYWSYIKGAHETQPNQTCANYPAWEQAASRVLYWLASRVHVICLAIFKIRKHLNKLGKNSRRFLRPTRCHAATRVRVEGRDHGGLGLRSRGERILHEMEASLKKEEDEYDIKIEQEDDGGKIINKLY